MLLTTPRPRPTGALRTSRCLAIRSPAPALLSRPARSPQPPAAGTPGDATAPAPPAGAAAAAAAAAAAEEEEEEEVVLLPEEDYEVPGTANDSLTSNTQLGRAVGAACEELEGLAACEAEAAGAAAELLLKIGYRVERTAKAVEVGEEEDGGGGGDGAAGAA